MEYVIDPQSKHKCAHKQCKCQIQSSQDYCSDYCSDADDVHEVEL
jgi:hypothetical protein